MGFNLKDLQMDCRFFSGYKPCSLNDKCNAQCPSKQIANPRILIIHLEALGAVLRGTALLCSIKRKWPQAHITWITSSGAAPLLENNHLIDRLLKNDHQGALALSTLGFDYGFCVDKSLVAAGLLQVPLEIKEKRGFGALDSGGIIPLNIEAQRSFELGLSNFEKFFVNKKPETQLIIESLGLDFQNDEYVLDFSKRDLLELENARRELFGLKKFEHPVIGLNTGCSPTIPYKKFSSKGWVELVDVLRKDFPQARILLLGGPEDTLRNEEIKAERPGSCVLTPTTSGLRTGLHYANLCDVVVTGDSLGMHMAIALKKWVVAWFGPTCAHEIDLYGRGIAVKTTAPCSPCWKRECEKPVMCYDQVNFEEVSQGVRLGLSPDKVFAPVAKKIPEISL
jgi:heptosyltransferase II